MCNRLREKNSTNVGGVIVIGLDEMENGNLEGTRKKADTWAFITDRRYY